MYWHLNKAEILKYSTFTCSRQFVFSSFAVVNIGEGTIIKLLNFLFVSSLLFLLIVGTGRFSALREVCGMHDSTSLLSNWHEVSSSLVFKKCFYS